MAMVYGLKRSQQDAISNVLFAICGYGTVIYWLHRCLLSPDSTNYLTAAKNLVEHGRMFVFTNWPNLTLEPIEVPYSVQPFGYPLYLAAFILVFHDPLVSALIAQSVSIVLLFFALHRFTRLAKLKFSLRVTLLFIICSIQSLTDIFANLWTESLFLALTLLLLLSVNRAYSKNRRRWDSLISAGLLVSTASLRFIGVFGLGFFVPALLRGRLRFRSFVGFGLLAMVPNLFWYARNRILSGGNFAEHYGWSSAHIGARLANVVQSLKYSLAFDSYLVLLLFVALIIIAIRYARSVENALPRESGSIGETALAGLLGHFLGLTLLGALSTIGDLLVPEREQARLLVTVYILFFLWAHTLVNRLPPRGYIVGMLCFMSLLANPKFFYLRSRLEFYPSIRSPIERELWAEIREKSVVKNASFFYSNYNFIHQVFSGKTQRIIWDGVENLKNLSPASQQKILEKMKSSAKPFLLVELNSELRRFADTKVGAWGLERLDLSRYGFFLYSFKNE